MPGPYESESEKAIIFIFAIREYLKRTHQFKEEIRFQREMEEFLEEYDSEDVGTFFVVASQTLFDPMEPDSVGDTSYKEFLKNLKIFKGTHDDELTTLTKELTVVESKIEMLREQHFQAAQDAGIYDALRQNPALPVNAGELVVLRQLHNEINDIRQKSDEIKNEKYNEQVNRYIRPAITPSPSDGRPTPKPSHEKAPLLSSPPIQKPIVETILEEDLKAHKRAFGNDIKVLGATMRARENLSKIQGDPALKVQNAPTSVIKVCMETMQKSDDHRKTDPRTSKINELQYEKLKIEQDVESIKRKKLEEIEQKDEKPFSSTAPNPFK